MSDLTPHGPSGIERVGHRKYVGGQWETLGQLQFEFLIDAGLQPSDVLVDIGCGALRAGVHLIPYLDPGHYIGVEQHRDLIQHALDEEVPPNTRAEKMPQFIVDDTFDFQRMNRTPTFAWAQSVFTHLTKSKVRQCLRRLRPTISDLGQFYATVWFSDEPDRPDESHDHRAFPYREVELRAVADDTQWSLTRIGAWGHPRGQQMVRFDPA